MLKVDANLRRLCGFKTADNVANESKFSPAFAEFAMGELPRRLYAAIIEATQKECLVGHIARAFTAIPVGERFGERQQRSQEQNSRAPK